jgi:hypothetical protein
VGTGRRSPAELHGRERRGDGGGRRRRLGLVGCGGRQALGVETARCSLEEEAAVTGTVGSCARGKALCLSGATYDSGDVWHGLRVNH